MVDSSSQCNTTFDVDQVKRRLTALIAEWRSLQKAELETGNPVDDMIVYPDYYQVMVDVMQVLHCSHSYQD